MIDTAARHPATLAWFAFVAGAVSFWMAHGL